MTSVIVLTALISLINAAARVVVIALALKDAPPKDRAEILKALRPSSHEPRCAEHDGTRRFDARANRAGGED